MSANADEQFRFINLLALELTNGNISLPSLPDVVMKIRNMLENDNATFDMISGVVTVDPVLVSKLFLYANSALYNRAGVTIDSLEGAIGRLGFEVVRNTAMSIAMEQLYSAEKHSKGRKHIKATWARSMRMSSMGWAVARTKREVNEESAFLAGLMHDVGRLYIITKADDFPEMLGDEQGFRDVIAKWNAQISKSIIESWGFNEEMAESADVPSYVTDNGAEDARLVDVMCVSELLVDNLKEEEPLELSEIPSCRKLGVDEASIGGVMDRYREKLKSMQSSLS